MKNIFLLIVGVVLLILSACNFENGSESIIKRYFSLDIIFYGLEKFLAIEDDDLCDFKINLKGLCKDGLLLIFRETMEKYLIDEYIKLE